MIVLASASPRRQELLRSAGISFVVQAADIDETVLAGEAPRACAERLAREKALAVWRTRPEDVVLGADTIVVVNEIILGKPSDAENAIRMLRLLSGRVHRVITGVAVAGEQWPVGSKAAVPSDQFPVSSKAEKQLARLPVIGSEAQATGNLQATTASETTLVTMCELSDEEIREYVETGEPMDKAGAYAIQGRASRWIPRIEGDYSNVVGLPVALVYRLLRERGAEG